MSRVLFLPLVLLVVGFLVVFIPQLPDFFAQQFYTQMIYFSLAVMALGSVVLLIFRRQL